MGASCLGGTCVCSDVAPDVCDGRCISLSTDASHCGACGRACTADTVCRDGACGCADSTRSLCGGACVILAWDPDHCGACNAACDAECVAGRCLGVRSLHVGDTHSCVVLEDDRVACWGSNLGGRLSPSAGGTSLTRPIVIAEAVIDAGSALRVGGGQTCSLVAGVVRCWGDNLYGEIDPSDPGGGGLAPTTVAGIPFAIELLAGVGYTCILDAAGQPLCWGERQWFSDFGAGAEPPIPWGAATDLIALAGWGRPCGLAADGRARCDTLSGPSPDPYPWPVVEWEGAIAVAVSRDHGCAVLSDGRVHCRGSNDYGQVGTGSTNDRSELVGSDVPLPMPAADVQVGDNHSCALLDDGRVYCWGASRHGQSGTIATNVLEPRAIAGVDRVESLACAGVHCCAWRGAMDVRCWGHGGLGRLGDGSMDDSATAVQVDFTNVR